MNRFQDQVVLISGGLGAMGMAIARRLLSEGARVVLGDLAQDHEARIAAAFRTGPRPEGLVLDVTRAESWEQAVAHVLGLHGHLDVLVNNAGVVSTQSVAFDAIDLDEWRRVFEINVDGTLLGLQAGMRAMKTPRGRGGAIVNIGSIAGYVGSKEGGTYGASKAAVRNMTQQAAISAARNGYGVRVNAVHPGYVWTPLIERKLIDQFGSEEKARAAVCAMNPLGEIVKVEDVAAAVAFLASPDAKMITGADLVIDGGRLIQ